MIPYEIDSSLHPSEPLLETLDDGFSPPHHDDIAAPSQKHIELPVEPGWDEPSPF